jgi:circadian clock protein KaiC
MSHPLNGHSASSRTLPKAPTGISGFDEITDGGLPRGRTSLVCGSAGCGKTLFAMEFLVRGATQFDEPGVFIAFEETPEDLVKNVRSLGFDLDELSDQNKVAVDYIRVERSEIDEAGEYDLEGLFLRIGLAIDSVGAKRVVLDTIETLFAGFDNQAVLRSELRRLFGYLKQRGVTAIITGERGEGQLTRQGLEEYVSDCVILLDHRVTDQISTRRLRVVKYRGTTHGTNEYPFLIDSAGITVLPITSLALEHEANGERISSGVPRLDAMLGGEGFYRGSSILVSGTAGTGKSSLSAHFADATCRRGERCLYFAFEESQSQIIRNMRSIGIDLQPWVDQGLLQFHATRPTMHGLEMHLALTHKQVRDFSPQVVVVDPVSNLMAAGSRREAEAMLLRLVDFLKGQGITTFMTSLTSGGHSLEATEQGLSSIVDSWLLLRDIELGGERNRGLYVLKSRGMAHSNQIREFVLTDKGIDLLDVYVGPEGVLTGSMRVAQEAREKALRLGREQEIELKHRKLAQKRKAVEAQIAALMAELHAEEEESHIVSNQERDRETTLLEDRRQMASSRKADRSDGVKEALQKVKL